MNADDQNFEALQRLLKLKRHEKPPPRYFNDFSSRVISRIEAEAAATEMSWFQKLVATFQNKPSLAGFAGAAVCGLLVAGVVMTENAQFDPGAPIAGSPHSQAVATETTPVFGNEALAAFNSTNPVAGSSIFDAVKINTMPAGFQPGSN